MTLVCQKQYNSRNLDLAQQQRKEWMQNEKLILNAKIKHLLIEIPQIEV